MKNSSFYGLLMLVLAAHLPGFAQDVIEVDSAQLAEICRELLLSKQWFNLTYLGEPYLDKPHLLFWLGAWSMKLFGVSSMAYKLPSLLFAALCVWSVYGFAQQFYRTETARMAALMTATIQAMFIATNDVRTDTVLMGAVMFSLWQLGAFFKSNSTGHLLAGFAGIAIAVSTKGPIGLMVPLFAFLPALMFMGNMRLLFQLKIIWAIVLLLLGLVPVSWAHYHQFGWEGLHFFYWTQSFGRITGESSWSNNPDPFFVVHTTLWAFLPFTLFLLGGLYFRVRDLLGKRVVPELFLFFGVVITLFALSRSNYQLPHYFYVVYPLATVMAADAFNRLLTENPWLKWVQYVLIGAAIVLVLLIAFYVFDNSLEVRLFFGVGTVLLLLVCLKWRNVFAQTLVVFCWLNICLGAVFYPHLLKYQSNTVIGKYLNAQGVQENQLTVFDSWRTYALSFHAQLIPHSTNSMEDLKQRINTKPHYIVCSQEKAAEIKSIISVTEVLTAADFPISQLNIRFLNPETRANSIRKVVLLKVH